MDLGPSTIAAHACMPDVPPYPDTKVTLAFGNDTMPVLVTKMKSDSVEVLRAALQAAGRLLPTSLNAAKAVSAGAVPELVRLCSHDDVVVRQRASAAVEVAMVNPSVKRAFVEGAAGEVCCFSLVRTEPAFVEVRHPVRTPASAMYFGGVVDGLVGWLVLPMLRSVAG